MIPISGIMNHISEMAHAETLFTKHISTRVAVLFGAFPLELCASLENAIKLPFQTSLALVKLACKAIDLCHDSQSIKNVTDKLPGLSDLIKTVLKIAGYAAGAFVTLSFGILRPYDNFRLHAAFQLVKNEKVLAEKKAAELKALTERQEQERAMQTHLENLILIMRQKAMERETQLAAELSQDNSPQAPKEIVKETPIEVATPCIEKFDNTNYKNFMNNEINRRLIQEHRRIVSAI